MADARGPQGIMSRGANVYNGGMPMAQSGSGKPGMGRPSIAGPPPSQAPGQGMLSNMGATNAQAGVTPSDTTMVGSLPPEGGTLDPNMNNAILNLLKARQAQGAQGGYGYGA
jgi:hypothetical protein